MAEILVGGYTPETYDAEKDPTGAIGHSLADALYQQYGSAAFSPRKMSDRQYLENLARTALSRFPEQAPGETIHCSEISRRLGEIRSLGYDVPPYSKLSKDKKWTLLNKIRSDVRSMCRDHPDILSAIDQENRSRMEGVEFLR